VYFRSHPHLANNFGAMLLVGLIFGNCFSILLKFRGGKGIATVIGGTAILMPSVAFLGVVLWYFVFFATRFVSFASLCLRCPCPPMPICLPIKRKFLG
jgi:glycerol-3-phosphate acyltransferase PlsY